MNTHFVFFNDTEIGQQGFTSRDAALAFINSRLAAATDGSLENYQLIEGLQLPLTVAERITVAEVDVDAEQALRAAAAAQAADVG